MQLDVLERTRQTNPWLFGGPPVGTRGPSRLPTPWVDRAQVPAGALQMADRAHLVVGPRQAGKSSLLWSQLSALQRPLYVNLEEPTFRSWCRSPAQFLADLPNFGATPDALFFEEAQWLDDAALFIKGLVDLRPGVPILVTGSASFHLHDRTRESLAGRASRHWLLPFSLREVEPDDGRPAAALTLARRDAMRRQLTLGSYPEVWLKPSPFRSLGDLLEAFVLRDASDLFKIERLDAYQTILQLCARGVGNLINLSELATVSGVAVGTVSSYLTIMEQAHVVRLLPSFSGGKRREVTSARKAYFLDNGLRNAAAGRLRDDPDHSADRGPLRENWVYTELAKELPWHQTIRYWRSSGGAEVDFVIEHGDRLLAIEVKSKALRRPTLRRSSRSFIDAYAPAELWVLNDELTATASLNETKLVYAPLHELPDRIGRWLDDER